MFARKASTGASLGDAHPNGKSCLVAGNTAGGGGGLAGTEAIERHPEA